MDRSAAWGLSDEIVLIGAGDPIPVPGRGDLTYPYRAHSDYYYLTDRNSPGVHPIEWSLAWVALGAAVFLVWAKLERTWPFGPKEIKEDYLDGIPADAADPDLTASTPS